MKRAVVLAAVATVLFAAALPAQAGVIKKWSVGVGVHGGLEKVDGDTKWDDTLITGAQLGLAITPGFQVELLYASFTTEDPGNDSTGDITNDYTGLRFVGTFFAQEDTSVLPYVAAGVGTVETEIEFDKADSVTDEATYGELSFGARVFVWKDLQVRGEVGFRQARTVEVTQTNAHVTVGVSYFFGGVE